MTYQKDGNSMMFTLYTVSEQQGFTKVPSIDIPLHLEVVVNVKYEVIKLEDKSGISSGVS